MSAPDVLAVMNLAGEALEHSELIERKSITRDEVEEARAAVAELAHKAISAADALEASANPKDRSKGRMLRAALARCGGAK